MSTPATKALDHRCTPWLFATALATTIPHAAHQPLWLSSLTALIIIYAGWLWWRNARLPGRWLLMLLVGIACAGVLGEMEDSGKRESND